MNPHRTIALVSLTVSIFGCGSAFQEGTTDQDSAPPGQDCCGQQAEAGVDDASPRHDAGKPKVSKDSGKDSGDVQDSGCIACDADAGSDSPMTDTSPQPEAGSDTNDAASPDAASPDGDSGMPMPDSGTHPETGPDSAIDTGTPVEAGPPDSGMVSDSSGGDTGITETGAYDGPVIVDPTTPCSAPTVGGIGLGEQVFEDGGPAPSNGTILVDGSWVLNPDAGPPPGSIFLSYYDNGSDGTIATGYAYGVSGACVDPTALCGTTSSAETYEGIGVNLNQAIGEGPASSPANPVALTGTGISVSITASAASSFQIIVDNAGVDYCSPSEASGALVSVPWSEFKSCAGGVALGTSPPTSATHIEFVTLDPGLNFCVTSLGPAT